MRGVLLLVALAALATPPARAQPNDELANLKTEQARLRQSLDDIDQRIRALERANPSTKSGVVPTTNPVALESVPPFVTLQRNWSEIRPGTSRALVNELLGKPEREMRINGDLVWYYVYPGIGRGSVFFSGADKVTSVQAPRSGWSW